MTHANPTTKHQLKQEVYGPQRELRKRQRRCFWTWPFGHIWETTTDEWWVVECANCGKTELKADAA